MKAVVLTGIRAMSVVETAAPALSAPDDVLVKIAAVGVCGSDVHYYTTGRTGSRMVRYPWIVGHEFSGTVVEVGTSVLSVKPGDRIAVDPAVSCLRCDQCLAGRPNTCRDLKFYSCPGELEGALREYMVVPQRCCHLIPDTMTFEQAAVAEPLSVGIYSVRRSGANGEHAVAVLGAGPIGLSVILALRARGLSCIYATDPISSRCTAALALGAMRTASPAQTDIVSAFVTGSRAPQPLGFDIVFECCGEQAAIDQAFDLLKPGGLLVVVGIPREQRISFDMDAFRRRELTVLYIRRQNDCTRAALDMIENGPAQIDPMITHRFSLDKTQDAFDLVAGYNDGVIKAMICV
jgi:L-iditol 2-dehydrogenase